MNPLKLGAATAAGTTMGEASLLPQNGRGRSCIDVATTLYKAAQSPGGRPWLRDARMGRMADTFGVAEPEPLLFPCKSSD